MSTFAIRATRGVLAGIVLSLCFHGAARAGDDAVEDIVAVLRDKGLIDDATEQQILAKRRRQQAAETKPVGAAGFQFLEGFVWSGDLRLRNEQFWYGDSFGAEADDRNRNRYRARLGFTKPINESVRIGMRLASGTDFNSTNVSFGDTEDFNRDTIAIDQAWAEVVLPGADSGLDARLVGGKVENPFVWKNSYDRILWDNDISPEGVYLRATASPAEGSSLWGTLGYFVVDENADSKDPKVMGLQLGGSTALSGAEVGARVSAYEWRALDDAFVSRNVAGAGPTTGGNLVGAFDDDRARVGEASAYLRLPKAAWPALFYAQYLQNFNAENVGGFGKEDVAWGAGLEVGDPKRLVSLSAAWFHVEANSTPSRFTDRDLFDGFTNREGFMLSAYRELAARIGVRLTYFDGEEISDHLVAPALGNVAYNAGHADRQRLQSDLEIKF